MIRVLAIALFGFAMSFSAAEAGICRHTGLFTGKTKTWSCKSGQVCCSAGILGYYGCGTNKLGGCIKM
jgi:hypothetical protein